MPQISSKIGTWNFEHAHRWQDRGKEVEFVAQDLVRPDTKIATIGSCFAEELAQGLSRFGLSGGMHPAGLFYNTSTMRQEIERIFGGWSQREVEDNWKIKEGWISPFKNLKQSFKSEAELNAWVQETDQKADQLFHEADVIVMTVGITEVWQNTRTHNIFRQLPHPDIFESIPAAMTRLTVSQMLEDLNRIRELFVANGNPQIVITVSPVAMHFTVTEEHIQVANCDAKSRIRAAVSEFVESNSDVIYFPSYEMVTTAERSSDFMKSDGRHVHRHAVDYIIHRFLSAFAPQLDLQAIDKSWISQPEKTAARPGEEVIGIKEALKRLGREIRRRF